MGNTMRLAAALCAFVLAPLAARAQVVSLAPQPAGAPQGWTFDIAPYAWLPTVNAQLAAPTPRGGVLDASISVKPIDLVRHINFGTLVGAEARNGPFSIMTDLIYLNESLTTSNSHLSSINFGPGPIYIPRSLQLNTGTRLAATVWTAAGGYTLLDGDWGNIDALEGVQLLGINSTTNHGLRLDIYLPNRTIALARHGSVNINQTYAEGIGGLTGRVNIPGSKVFFPFYIDAGGGSLAFTWQAYAAIAYPITTWGDVSVGYRYLRFENGGSSGSTGLLDTSMSGVISALNIRF